MTGESLCTRDYYQRAGSIQYVPQGIHTVYYVSIEHAFGNVYINIIHIGDLVLCPEK